MKLLIFSVVTVALIAPASAMASTSWQNLSGQTAQHALAAAPAATNGFTINRFPSPAQPSQALGTPKFFANFVASGIATNGVPCFNCVTGVPSALGIPDPFNYVPSNTVMQYNVAWTNLTFNGTCIVAIAITSGQTLIDSASFNVPGIKGAGGFDIGLNRNRPTFSGRALITGKVTCGPHSSSVTANLIYQ